MLFQTLLPSLFFFISEVLINPAFVCNFSYQKFSTNTRNPKSLQYLRKIQLPERKIVIAVHGAVGGRRLLFKDYEGGLVQP